VADVLFGDKPFTGRLPISWAVAESQLPLNVGDATYNPLYAFGWGLRTDNAHDRLLGVRNDLATVHGDRGITDAVNALDRALRNENWNRDGSVRGADQVLTALKDATAALNRTSADSWAQDNLVVSVARDIVQGKVATAGPAGMPVTAALTSDAEHALLVNRPDQAVQLLIQAYNALRYA
jgi:beta-glucosidase